MGQIITGKNLDYLLMFLEEERQLRLDGYCTAKLEVEILPSGVPFVQWKYERANEMTGELEIWSACRSQYTRSDTYLKDWYQDWEDDYE